MTIVVVGGWKSEAVRGVESRFKVKAECGGAINPTEEASSKIAKSIVGEGRNLRRDLSLNGVAEE